MNEQFKVGDICIGQNFVTHPYRNNMQCEVIDPLQYVSAYNEVLGRNVEGLQYGVRWTDGAESWCRPNRLRRKPPKQSDKEWAEGKVREITQDSVHVASGSKHLIPEEAA